MTPRHPSSQTREEAIEILLVSAFAMPHETWLWGDTVLAAEEIGASREAALLAKASWSAVCDRHWSSHDGRALHDSSLRAEKAEAAALLDEGWLPGDELKVTR